MKFIVLTLFPQFIYPLLEFSIIKRAIQKKIVEIEVVDFRKYAENKTKRVDEYQIGGGEGMVIQLPPVVAALKKHCQNSHKILLTPQGELLKQAKLKQLTKYDTITLLCGHYEGFDERILHYVDESISIGDYVLTNGEMAALIVIDGISRLLNEVIKPASHENESFNNYLLDYPIYTKPLEFEGYKVPAVLMSGHHRKIAEFRLNEQIKKTKEKRPDLYRKFIRSKQHE